MNGHFKAWFCSQRHVFKIKHLASVTALPKSRFRSFDLYHRTDRSTFDVTVPFLYMYNLYAFVCAQSIVVVRFDIVALEAGNGSAASHGPAASERSRTLAINELGLCVIPTFTTMLSYSYFALT